MQDGEGSVAARRKEHLGPRDPVHNTGKGGEKTEVRTWNYGNYASSNYGSSRAVQIGRLTLFFSYETVVAFRDESRFYCSENVWSTTTGRHLNCILSDHKARIPNDEFKKRLEETLQKYKLHC